MLLPKITDGSATNFLDFSSTFTSQQTSSGKALSHALRRLHQRHNTIDMADDGIDLEALFSQRGSDAGGEERKDAHDSPSEGNEGMSDPAIPVQA